MFKSLKNILLKNKTKKDIPIKPDEKSKTNNENLKVEDVKNKNINVNKTSYKNHDLIVDDSDPNRSVLKKYLVRYNRTSDEAINGEDVINKIKECMSNNKEFDIVWMDISMPKINGILATKEIREKCNYKGIIIGLTGHIDEESVKQCKLAGMNEVMAKPIDKKVLEMYIEKYGS